MNLRDYQLEALGALHQARREGMQRMLVVLPTGTGKTVVFSRWAKDRMRHGPILVMAHRDELLEQAGDKLRMVQPDLWVGLVKAGMNQLDYPVVVASVQTLARTKRLQQLPQDGWAGVIVDEAHHASADSYQRAMEWVGCYREGGPPAAGFTATPERADKLALGDTWEGVVYQRQMLDMIQAGYLCDLRGLRLRLQLDMSDVRTRRGDYVEADSAKALLRAEAPRYVAEAYLEHARDRKGLVFTPTVDVAHRMAEAFQEVGIAAAVVHGQMRQEDRKRTLADLATGAIQVVCNCAVLTEGFDQPDIACVVIARPTRSRALYVQCIGRGTRPHPGKRDCLIIDVVGASDRHDLLTMPALFTSRPVDDEELATSSASSLGLGAGTSSERVIGAEAQEIDLMMGRSRFAWVKTAGAWLLPGPDGAQVALHAAGATWDVLVLPKDRKAELLVLAEHLELGYAQGIAEDWLRTQRAAILADKDAAWRSHDATPDMLRAMERWGIPIRPGITKGEASELLNAKAGQARLRQRGRAA